jgi:polysaccharide export outer membrane protein
MWNSMVLRIGIGMLAAALGWSQTRDTERRDRREEGRPEPPRLAPSTPPSQTPTPALSATPAADADFLPFTAYRLGPEDLLVVTVLDAPEFSRSVRVNAEGVIRLPLVRQSIAASGKTTAELEQTIARVLLEEGLLREPSVSVTVREFQSKPVTVSGAVRTPVVFQALRPVTLTEALARAGGVTEMAGPDVLVSVPASEGRPAREVRLSLLSLLQQADAASNLLLHGGEEIRVPAAGRVYIIGAVTRPGPILLSDGQPLSLLQAVSLAGGPGPTAAKKAYLLRQSETDPQRRELAFDLKKVMKDKDQNLLLRPNDVIFVPDSFFKRTTQGGMSAAVSSFAYAAMGVLLWR